MSRRVLRPVGARFMNRPCPQCRERPVKLPGLLRPLCLHCWAEERQEQERQAITAGQPTAGLPIGAVCPGCGSRDVDADGAVWWCNGRCGLTTRVALPMPELDD